MKKIILIVGIIVAVLIGGFFVLNTYIYQQKQGTSNTINRYRGTLTGEYVCLPDADQTRECALGIKTDANEYYALDFNLLSQDRPALATGDRFVASGMITPIEMLSTDHWQQYNIEGIFSVTDSVKKL